ncbi:MAG: GRAS family protein, partial [Gemmatimonadota bacterium]|nr:GRAS family protein [Gemmatimonadota bacterium]
PTSPSAKYHSLLAVLHEAHDERPEVARQVLDVLVDRQLDRESDDDVRYYVFANALAKRISTEPSASINLYLREYAQPQIELFNLVATHLPTVSAAGIVANRMLARHLGGRRAVTLLDIGIGTARQEVALLHDMARAGLLPDRLTVVAVEPNAHCLATAERALRDTAATLGLDLQFRGISAVIEDLSPEEWVTLRPDDEPLVVHAAFAAHHIRSGAGEGRDEVFERLHALDPEAIVLCEPNADHHTQSFFRRFESAWDHFSRTFHLIDQLDIAPRDRRAMKLFFTREIEDIVANDESERCERHEPVAAWVNRLSRRGFGPASDLAGAAALRMSHIATSVHDGWVGLDFDGVTLVAIVCASRVVSDRPLERSSPGGSLERVTDDGRFRQYPSGGDMLPVPRRTN